MGLPIRQAAKIGAYVMKKHLSGGKYPLVLMLEPLFRDPEPAPVLPAVHGRDR
jgi:hypothetical protein